ncbi:MAG: sensor histidine kinase, partial [Deltaproteobacteria bacterium]|nr:sensor histidine kinase [Deltaproteobacteria bacterium]
RDVTERKTAEEALRESQGQLRSLAVHLQQIQEKERSRIARDIHDEFGQLLTAMKYDLSWMKRRLHEDQEPLVEMSEKMSKLIENAVKTVQRISSELRPALLDDLGLVAAIEWYAGEYQDRTGTKCAVTCDPDEIILDRELSTAVFRAFQEALTNVARHADATKVEVSLKKDDRELVLNVRDDGKGITEEDIFDSKSFYRRGYLRF